MKNLIKKALETRKKAYAPYSKFFVGAALETDDGKIYTGCNIENSSLGITVCAERVALFNAISSGARKLRRIAVVADMKTPCPPCGICRQALFEFAPDLEVIMTNLKGEVRKSKLSALLPKAFRFNLAAPAHKKGR